MLRNLQGIWDWHHQCMCKPQVGWHIGPESPVLDPKTSCFLDGSETAPPPATEAGTILLSPAQRHELPRDFILVKSRLCVKVSNDASLSALWPLAGTTSTQQPSMAAGQITFRPPAIEDENDIHVTASLSPDGFFDVQRIDQKLSNPPKFSISSSGAQAAAAAAKVRRTVLLFTTASGRRFELEDQVRGRPFRFRADRLRQITGVAGTAADPFKPDLLTTARSPGAPQVLYTYI